MIFSPYVLSEDPVKSQEYFLFDGSPLSSSSILISEPIIREDEEEWEELKWEWAEESSFDKFRRFLTLGSQRLAQAWKRKVKRSITRRYDADGQVLSEEYNEPQYGPWVEASDKVLHNGWGDPSDPHLPIAGSGGVYVSIQLEKYKKSEPTIHWNNRSEADEAMTKSLKAQAVDGFEWDSYSIDRSDDPLGQFYSVGPNRNDYLVPTDVDGFGVGDIILNQGITPEMVRQAGFDYGPDTKFVTITKDQLAKSKVPNTVGHIPTKYDFLLVTSFNITKEYKTVTISDQNKGQITITRGMVRSYVEAYSVK